jgi:eukaryotic-like serine/threonine-protein kinase
MDASFGQRWRIISAHLDQALELSDDDRLDWIEKLRAEDADLATELERCLSEHGALSAAGYLENSPLPAAHRAVAISCSQLVAPMAALGPGLHDTFIPPLHAWPLDGDEASSGGDPALQRVLQEEHAANVSCLLQALKVAVIAWPSFIILDGLVTSTVEGWSFSTFFVLRAFGELSILLGCLQLSRGSSLISRRYLRWVDGLVFVLASVLVSLMCIGSGGLLSPYAAGIPVIMICRGAFAAQCWKEAALSTALTAAAYPLVVLLSWGWSPLIREQVVSAPAIMHGTVYLTLIVCTGIFAVLGGHTRWTLRRQVFAARSVGRYRLIRRLGSGGMGEVWAAEHRGLKRQVAIKILRADERHHRIAVGRFEREAHALSELTHPNTVRVFDFGVTADGLWYYAMELLEGQNLGQLVAHDGPLSWERAVRLMLQASRALAEAHARGIVHRDIKPENIFVTNAGGEPDLVKLLDFGIAKVSRPHMTITTVGWLGGTPTFMSPEAAMGEPADSRSDVYSLGATLYFSLTGQPPFKLESVAALLHAHIATKPCPPSDLATSQVPEGIDAIVLRCLSKDASARYSNASELAEALIGAIA